MPDPQFVSDGPPAGSKARPPAAPVVMEPAMLVIHVIEDGLTASGRVWYRGQELEYLPDSEQYKATLDRNGRSWLDYDDREQMQRWGRIMFRPGPWPGRGYEEEKAVEAERRRGRTLPAPPPVPAA